MSGVAKQINGTAQEHYINSNGRFTIYNMSPKFSFQSCLIPHTKMRNACEKFYHEWACMASKIKRKKNEIDIVLPKHIYF